jgi:hypothetical protein
LSLALLRAAKLCRFWLSEGDVKGETPICSVLALRLKTNKHSAWHIAERDLNLAMPRYFFHLRKDEDLIPDDEGAEFEDLTAARTEAAHTCRELAIEEIRRGGPVAFCNVEIWDESGKVLDIIQARVILDPLLGPTH